MGIFASKPRLDQAETVVWQQLANRTQSAGRAFGGRLYLTGTRLLFEPNRVDAATGGENWSAPLTDIKSVGKQPRDGNPLNGGLRDRLRLMLADGSAELFVVNRLDKVIGVVQGAVARAT
jgi:hypothetical protein